MPRVREAVERIIAELATEREKAIALHDYVRDDIKFGFNSYFDLSKPNHENVGVFILDRVRCKVKDEDLAQRQHGRSQRANSK
jgi:hypothetical protein